jgi:hypothetical protein
VGCEGRRELRRLSGHFGGVPALALSTDGQLFASGGEDGNICVWEVTTGKRIAMLTGHERAVNALAFSPDCRQLISASDDRTAIIWDLTGHVAHKGMLEPDTSADVFEVLWKELAGIDGWRAVRASWRLVALGEKTVTLLQGKLQPLEGIKRRELDRLIDKLDDERLEVRRDAQRKMENMTVRPTGYLKSRLEVARSAQQASNLETVLKSWERQNLSPSEDMLQAIRGLAVLERIGSKGAMEVIPRIAQGSEDSELTVAAVDTIIRMSKKKRLSSNPDK